MNKIVGQGAERRERGAGGWEGGGGTQSVLHTQDRCSCRTETNGLSMSKLSFLIRSMQTQVSFWKYWYMHSCSFCCCCCCCCCCCPSNMFVYLIGRSILYVLPHWDRSCRSNFQSHPANILTPSQPVLTLTPQHPAADTTE